MWLAKVSCKDWIPLKPLQSEARLISPPDYSIDLSHALSTQNNLWRCLNTWEKAFNSFKNISSISFSRSIANTILAYCFSEFPADQPQLQTVVCPDWSCPQQHFAFSSFTNWCFFSAIKSGSLFGLPLGTIKENAMSDRKLEWSEIDGSGRYKSPSASVEVWGDRRLPDLSAPFIRCRDYVEASRIEGILSVAEV